ncbi:MAG TPA: HEAT repeat domain-containing protein [Terriglobales bacterium]|nr:HEAT repeat domain-containing protein [Terriglobales bacterium]
MNCEWVKENIPSYLYDELGDDARHELEQHLARCAGCAAEADSVRELKQEASALPRIEPTPNLVAASRMRLLESLETVRPAAGWQRFVFDPGAWLRQIRFAPALAAAILMVGFTAGVLLTYRMGSRPGSSPAAPNESSIAGIRGITQEPGSNNVQVRYDRLVPESAQGSMDDPRIQQLLLYAARNNENSGVRMDSINLLTRRPDDTRVREALMYALRYDRNPGVRLKALDGLGDYVSEDVRVRNVVLEALLGDSNPGVRIEAIRLLEKVKPDSSVRKVFQQLAEQDQNDFIRREARRVLATMPELD